jgi:hypothetical protein
LAATGMSLLEALVKTQAKTSADMVSFLQLYTGISLTGTYWQLFDYVEFRKDIIIRDKKLTMICRCGTGGTKL